MKLFKLNPTIKYKESYMKRIVLVCIFSLVAIGASFAQPTTGFAQQPAVVTAAGQSADFEMIKVLLTRSKIEYTADTLMKPESLGAASKTLILVSGASTKGLGAAGISSEAEGARISSLIKRAKSLGMKIITVHVGGGARRGVISDALIEICMAGSDYAIVVADGDTDGFFTKLANASNIGLTKVDRISAVGKPLAASFK